MSDPVQMALIAGLPATIAALAALWQGITNGRKTDKVATKADQIHDLANGNFTRVSNELKTANERIARMEEQITILLEKKTQPDADTKRVE